MKFRNKIYPVFLFPFSIFCMFAGLPPPPPGAGKEHVTPEDKQLTSPTDNEVTLQWYQPSLEETDPSRPDASGAESRILLLYSIFNKALLGSASYQTKIVWVQMSQLNDLHDRYWNFLVICSKSEWICICCIALDKREYHVNIFIIFPWKHRLWVLIRSASVRHL